MLNMLSYVGHMMHWNDGGWYWMAIMLAFWVLVAILVVFLLVKYFSSHGSTGEGEKKETPRESPLDIAKRRYAAGEINHEEFETITQKLKET